MVPFHAERRYDGPGHACGRAGESITCECKKKITSGRRGKSRKPKTRTRYGTFNTLQSSRVPPVCSLCVHHTPYGPRATPSLSRFVPRNTHRATTTVECGSRSVHRCRWRTMFGLRKQRCVGDDWVYSSDPGLFLKCRSTANFIVTLVWGRRVFCS